MAAGPVTIAPVLTPRAVAELADAVERNELLDLAAALRQLKPFLEKVVEELFTPLTVSSGRDGFKRRFNRLSRKYEPFRLFLAFRLLEFFQNKDLLPFYERILRGMLGPLLKAAREMDMAPELIAALVSDYLHLFGYVKVATLSAQPRELTFEQFSLTVDCVLRATRFDYGLTATFLVLEGSIEEPRATNKMDLLVECKKSFFGFATAVVRMFDIQDGNRIIDTFESNKMEITGTGRRLQVVPQSRGRHTEGPSGPRRQAEIEWMNKNTLISDEYRGKWVVVENNELIASDKDYGRARAIAKERGIERPFIVFVPVKRSGGFMGI
jgi:hypothetical protein